VRQFHAPLQSRHYDFCHVWPAEVGWSDARGIEVAVHPDEGFTGRHFVRRRIQRVRQAAVKVPGDEEPFAVRVAVRETAAEFLHV
jgi:hypothetical protein